jgi:SNF2 family DNA or RNA helicase
MAIHLSRDKNRIVLRAPWSPSLPQECKSIPGYSFRASDKVWTYPLSMTTLRAMREVWGDALDVDPELWEWAKQENRREKMLKRVSKQTDAKLMVTMTQAPTLAVATLDRKYQRVAARFGAIAGSFLLADEPGLGKTATSIAALMEGKHWQGDILVIAPKTSIDSVWGDQIRRWVPKATVVTMPEGRPAREKALAGFWDAPVQPNQARVLVVNPAMLRRQWQHLCKKCDIWEEDVKAKKVHFPKEHSIEHGHRIVRAIRKEEWPEILNHQWEAVVLDESHQLLASYTPAAIKSQQMVQGLLDIKSEVRVALTGTPLRGHELRMWGTLNWLDPKRFNGYWDFAGMFFEVEEGVFGRRIAGLRADKRDEFYAAIDRFVLRRTRAEVRPDLPAGQRMDETVPLRGKHAKQYEEFRAAGELVLQGGLVEGLGTLSELTRLRQFAFGVWDKRGGKLVPTADSPVWERLLEMLAERGVTGKKTTEFLPEPGSGFKYVIVSQFTEVLDFAEREFARLKIPTLKISGQVTGKRRTDAARRFQSKDDDTRVMLIQTIAGGVAIELDAWADEMFLLDETFIADDQVQVEGRINNRSGRVAPRTWWYLRTEDTIAQDVASNNYEQHTLQHNLLDGRRGVETALHLIRKK